MDDLVALLGAGAGNLAAYLAAHVLLCLLPAFFIAGALAALVPKAGSSTMSGNATAVGIGVFMYFPTLVEVPVARIFLDITVTDMPQILQYDPLSTPGLVINDELVSSGRIPTQADVQGWLLA